jgi:hypothetical protein
VAIETEIIELVKVVPAFAAPIIAYFPGSTIASPNVAYRLCYDHVPQDVLKSPAPYLFWQGPFQNDIAQTAIGSGKTLRGTFLFHCIHDTMTQSMNWTDAIDKGIRAHFLAHPVVPLVTHRLVAAIFRDRYPMSEDIIQRTAEEFPVYHSVLEYRFGYQS